VTALREGERDPLEDASTIRVIDELRLQVVHDTPDATVTLFYEIETAYNDTDGAMKEFDLFED
jgi:hypothetical protein